MKLILPALDEANHAATRKPSAIAGALAFLGLILVLIYTEVLPVPKDRMTVALVAYGTMIVLTTLTFHHWGFRSTQYRVMLLLETLALLSGLAFSMAINPPGLPILWAFYLLLTVLTAQDVGANLWAMGVVVSPISVLLAFQALSGGAFGLGHYAYTVSCALLSAALFFFFGRNRETQLTLTARQVATERELSEARLSLEAQQRLHALDEQWLSILSKTASALVLLNDNLGVVAIRQDGTNALSMENDFAAGFLGLLRAQFDAAGQSHEPVVEFGVPLPNGRGFVDLRIVALPDSRREERFAVLIQDATARVTIEAQNRRLAQQMMTADKLSSVGLLAAGIAHEVNNPLSYVMGNVEYLLESEQLGPKAVGALTDVNKGLHEIAAIIGDLRGFSYNSTYSYRQTVDLREAVKRAHRLVAAEIREHADLRISLPAEPVYARCQAERIQQVIVNLLINASQALETRPWNENVMTLSLEATADGAEIRVTDNGVGMSEETQQKVFDLFYTTKPAGKGTGLGLSIAHSIARDHQGSLTVRSAIGKGSTFTLRLPGAAAPQANELHVLIVGADEPTVALYGKALDKFHVTTAASLHAALSLLGNGYDAVLCDVRLGDGSGFSLYERAPETLKKHFVFYTDLPADTPPDLLARPEGVPLLGKPLSPEQAEQALLAAAGRASNREPEAKGV